MHVNTGIDVLSVSFNNCIQCTGSAVVNWLQYFTVKLVPSTVLLLFSLVLGLHHQLSIVYSLDEKNLAKHFISTRVEDPLHEQGYGGMEPR